MSIAEHFASADRLIATARASWEDEKKILEQKIFELQTHVTLQADVIERLTIAKDESLRVTAKLLTQFGVVSQVFDDAKKTAIEAGLYTKTESEQKPDVDSERG